MVVLSQDQHTATVTKKHYVTGWLRLANLISLSSIPGERVQTNSPDQTMNYFKLTEAVNHCLKTYPNQKH